MVSQGTQGCDLKTGEALQLQSYDPYFIFYV